MFLRPWWTVAPGAFGTEAYLSGLFNNNQSPALYAITPDQYFKYDGDACTYRHEFWNQIGIPAGPDAESYAGAPG